MIGSAALLKQCLIPRFQKTEGRRIQQIETKAWIDYRADHAHLLTALLPSEFFLRKLERALRTVLPEVNPVTQPVIIVFTGLEMCVSRKDTLRRFLVRSMKTEQETRQQLVAGSSIDSSPRRLFSAFQSAWIYPL